MSNLEIKNALEGLASIDAEVEVSCATSGGACGAVATTWQVTFKGNLGELPLLTSDDGDVDATIQRVQAGVAEIQTITTSADIADMQGTFVVSYLGSYSSDIAFNADAVTPPAPIPICT